MNDQMLTTGQVSKMTGYCARTVCMWFDKGILTGYRIPGSKDRRISLASVIAMAKSVGMTIKDPEPRRKGGAYARPKKTSGGH